MRMGVDKVAKTVGKIPPPPEFLPRASMEVPDHRGILETQEK